MNTFQDGDFIYRVFHTSEISDEMKVQYVDIHNSVFKSGFCLNTFKKKFEDNIFGDSIHVIVYKDGEPCAIRSLWRNDCNDIVCYQPCDTGVLLSARGGGIFAKMTKYALDYIDVDKYDIYNFPNENSRRLYLKNGWRICAISYVKLFLSNKLYQAHSDRIIPDEYVKWYLMGEDPQLFIKRIGRAYYLVKLKGRYACIIIGQVTSELANMHIFETIKGRITFYRAINNSLLKLRPLYVVTTSKEDKYFDSWRIDAI